MTGFPPIRVHDVWARGCPLLRMAYDLQSLHAAGVNPHDIDAHLAHWASYDARERRRKQDAGDAGALLADIGAFHDAYPSTPPRAANRRRHAPRRHAPRRAA